MRWVGASSLVLLVVGCGGSGDGRDMSVASTTGSGSDTATSGTGQDTVSSSSSTSTSAGGTSETDSGAPPVFDIGSFDMGDTGADLCSVNEDGNALGECDVEAPPDSFEPIVEWSAELGDAIQTPLVANFTDDNNDGSIDLCDTPDVVVVTAPTVLMPGRVQVLDGASGTPHFQSAIDVNPSITPAIGDIDGDGLVEIVTASSNGSSQYGGADNRLVAFENDGSLKWENTGASDGGCCRAVALADLDNDGDVEILFGNRIYDHNGTMVQEFADDAGGTWASPTPTAADLDDDGDLEVILGRSAFQHDGTVVYSRTDLAHGTPSIADLDMDGDPEVFLVSDNGFSLLEADGTATYQEQQPSGAVDYRRPAAIHDMTGNGMPNIAVSASTDYSVYEPDLSLVWSAPVVDGSGLASGTAFDFLGDGTAEAMYGDENTLFIFGDNGSVLLMSARQSRTQIEYPTVVDVDNDGSAEILVVSEGDAYPTIQVVGDVMDRWIQARRIWNQHTYHVTNVLEDGRIPQFEPPHWTLLNTFRTNAQILSDGGGLCRPAG